MSSTIQSTDRYAGLGSGVERADYYYNPKGEDIYQVIIVGREESFENQHFGCSMTLPQMLKLRKTLKTDMYSGADWTFFEYLVASNITPTQSRKFDLLLSSWDALNEFLDHFGWTDDDWKTDDWRTSARKELHAELDVSKWNPRSVLGKLEFDRRAEADGIIYN